MLFKKDFLQNLKGQEGVDIISDVIVDHSRWSIVHEKIFKYDRKYYKTIYSIGATENQDEYPYQDDEDKIECEEVFPKIKTCVIFESEK